MKALYYTLGLLLCMQIISCNKFLDEKVDANLKEADNLGDLDALLNNTQIMNYYVMGLGEASADNYYLDNASWQAMEIVDREIYTWGPEIFFQNSLSTWLDYYKTIYYSNHVLARLTKISADPGKNKHANEIKGQAYFFRAFAFYKLLGLFSKAYDKESAATDLGIPLRLTDDFNVPSKRASVKDCYRQILDDLYTAENLLPIEQTNRHLPSVQAVYILLSFIYQNMQDFELSLDYSRKALSINNKLKDLNNYSPTERYPFMGSDDEIVFTVAGGAYTLLDKKYCKIDTALYRSYEEHDLRKKLFFDVNKDGSYYFKGSYAGSRGLFMGLTIADAYLTAIEALIRLNRIEESKEYLAIFLTNRYAEGHVPTFAEKSQNELLKITLNERRKEFVMRDSRWSDIKRLNRIDQEVITPIRRLEGKEVSLLQNDNRYALPLPAEIIEISGMQQNPR